MKKYPFKHGFAARNKKGHYAPIYRAWVQLRQRCNNSNNPDYHYYGGRGIKHCKRWNEFNNFFSDMNPTWKPGLTLDRIDGNKGYSPQNCKWSTRREQSNNRRYNHLFTYKGKTQSIGKWADELPINITSRNLYKRLITRNWSIERAFTQPLLS